MAVLIDKEQVALALGHPLGQRHGLRCGSSLIQQRGTGQLHTGQIDSQLLEVQQGLQAALGNLRLVRCVGGIPARILQHIAQNHRRRQGAVVAHTDTGGKHLIARGDLLQVAQHFGFATRRAQLQQLITHNTLRHGLTNQILQRVGAEGVEHGLLLGGIGADMSADEVVGLFQISEAERVTHEWLPAKDK